MPLTSRTLNRQGPATARPTSARDRPRGARRSLPCDRCLRRRERRRADQAAPQTLKKAAWGLTAHNGQSMFPIYKDLGIGIFQTQVRWDAVAPTRPANPTDPTDPAYKWGDGLQKIITEAEANGMTVMLQLIGAPTWANGGQDFIWPATNPTDYGNFAQAIAKKYPTVRHWMVWGEPNSKRGFGPVVNGPLSNNTRLNKKQQRAPKLYAQLLDAAYIGLQGRELGQSGDRRQHLPGRRQAGDPHPPVAALPEAPRRQPAPDGHVGPQPLHVPDPEPEVRALAARPDRLLRPRHPGQGARQGLPGQGLRLFLSEWGVPTGFDQDLEIRVKTSAAVKWVKAAMNIVFRSKLARRIYTLGWSVPVDTTRNPQGLLDMSLSPKPTYFPFKKG